jgi:hypothetical protein
MDMPRDGAKCMKVGPGGGGNCACAVGRYLIFSVPQTSFMTGSFPPYYRLSVLKLLRNSAAYHSSCPTYTLLVTYRGVPLENDVEIIS